MGSGSAQKSIVLYNRKIRRLVRRPQQGQGPVRRRRDYLIFPRWCLPWALPARQLGLSARAWRFLAVLRMRNGTSRLPFSLAISHKLSCPGSLRYGATDSARRACTMAPFTNDLTTFRMRLRITFAVPW